MSRVIKAGQAGKGWREAGTGVSAFPLTQLALPLPAGGPDGIGPAAGASAGGAGRGRGGAAAGEPGRSAAARQAQAEERLRAMQREAETLMAEARAERERLIAAGMAEKERLIAEGREERERLLAEARAERERLLEAVALDVAGLVTEAARRVLRHELACQPEAVIRLVRELMAEAGEQEAVTVRVNPAAAPLVAGHRDEVCADLPGTVELQVVADPSVAAGGAVVETPAGIWDGRVETQLAILEEALREVTGDGR